MLPRHKRWANNKKRDKLMKRLSILKNILILFLVAAMIPLHYVCVPDAEYIVKYRENSDFRRDEARFDVVSRAQLGFLLLTDEVEWFEQNEELELLGTISQYYPDDKWDLEMIGAEAAFSRGLIGDGVRVGIIDSGVNTHEFLADRVVPGHNYISNASDPDDTSDTYGHGTAVAGLIAGKSDEGYLGAAAGVTIVPLKCTDEKAGVKISDVCDAIYGGIDDYDCDVLNLSLGIASDYKSLEEAVAYAEKMGVVIVSAVGNDGTSTLYYPAAYETVIGVGGVDENGLLYDNSNFNESALITAPAVNLTSTFNMGGYATVTGTSFSTPQVTAAAAILLGARPELTPDEVRRALADTAVDLGSAGYDEYYGYGILSLSALVDYIDNPQKNTIITEQPEAPIHTDSPEENSNLKATCAKDEDCILRAFSDLDPSMWYHDGLHFALESKIMNGTGDGLFSPDAAASRAMIVTILWRMENEPKASAKLTFSDVRAGMWYTEAIRWATSNGIVSGYSADTFDPDGSITREQLAVILWRYAGSARDENLPLLNYTDAGSISSWAFEAVQWMTVNGILNGVGDGSLNPQGSASRAQAATLLMRLADIY